MADEHLRLHKFTQNVLLRESEASSAMRRTCVLRIRQLGRSIPSASSHPHTSTLGAGDSRRPEHHHHQIRLGFPHPCLSQIAAEVINSEAVPSAHVYSSQSGLADLRERNGSDSNPARVPQSDSDPDIQPGPSTRVHGRASLQTSTCRRITLLGATCATSARAISSAALRSCYGVETKARGWSWHQLRNARVNGSEVYIQAEGPCRCACVLVPYAVFFCPPYLRIVLTCPSLYILVWVSAAKRKHGRKKR